MGIPHNRMAFCQKALTRANWRVSPRIRSMHVVAFCQQVYKQWHFAKGSPNVSYYHILQEDRINVWQFAALTHFYQIIVDIGPRCISLISHNLQLFSVCLYQHQQSCVCSPLPRQRNREQASFKAWVINPRPLEYWTTTRLPEY